MAGSFEEVEGVEVEVEVEEAFSWAAVASIVLSGLNSIGVYGEYKMGVYGEGYGFDRVRRQGRYVVVVVTAGQIV